MQQDVIGRLFSIEDSISSAFSGDLFALKEFLGFHREYTHLNHLPLGLQANSGVSFESLSTKTKNMLKGLFVAYRAVDVAGALVSYPENPQKCEKSSDFRMQIQVRTLFPFENQHLLRVLQHFEQLEHWPSVLTSFRISQQPSLFIKGKFSERGSQNRHIAVLKYLMACKGAAAGLVNIQLAVISIHRMAIGVSALMPISVAINGLINNPSCKMNN